MNRYFVDTKGKLRLDGVILRDATPEEYKMYLAILSLEDQASKSLDAINEARKALEQVHAAPLVSATSH